MTKCPLSLSFSGLTLVYVLQNISVFLSQSGFELFLSNRTFDLEYALNVVLPKDNIRAIWYVLNRLAIDVPRRCVLLTFDVLGTSSRPARSCACIRPLW